MYRPTQKCHIGRRHQSWGEATGEFDRTPQFDRILARLGEFLIYEALSPIERDAEGVPAVIVIEPV